MDQFWTIFWSSIGTILTALVSWISVKIVNWLNAKLEDRNSSNYDSSIGSIVFNAVRSVFQTYVEKLKSEGEFNKEAQEEAKHRAVVIIESQLTTKLKEYITNNFGDIKEYISNRIESAIYTLKK